MNCNNDNKYILSIQSYACLNEKNIPSQDIYNVEEIKNITNNFFNINGLVGFTGIIEPAGCSGDVLTQENHILSVDGGSVSPKNIVIRTQGSNSTYGSYFRDDTLTNPKGDVRGSGANDLSTSRSLCSQVASGEFSSILGGTNNTSSGKLSTVIGGNSNISSGNSSIIIGGEKNTNNSTGSVIGSGSNNNVNNLGSGSNVIGAGENNSITGGYNVIFSGSNNQIDSSNCKYNVIINGETNVISSNAIQSVIGAGKTNRIEQSNSVISSGNNNIIKLNGSGYNYIGSGSNNQVSGTFNTIVSGEGNALISNDSSYNVIIGGSNNNIGDAQYSLIGGGVNNNIISGNINSILTGIGNTALGFSTIIGSGLNNFAKGNYNVILGGVTNLIDMSNSQYNVITSGIGNTIDASSVASFIGSGESNVILDELSVITSGRQNRIEQADGSGANFIGSGINNQIRGNFNVIISGLTGTIDSSSNYNAIISGNLNKITRNSFYSFIGSGDNNSISNQQSAIIVGNRNSISEGGTGYNIIGAGASNTNIGNFNVIMSGSNNLVEDSNSSYNVIVSGSNNKVITNATYSAIGSGINNTVFGDYNIIGAGSGNTGGGTGCMIGAGANNVIIGLQNAIMCGSNNQISNTSAIRNVITGGIRNKIISGISDSFIGSGSNNEISASQSAIFAGNNNIVLGPTAINSTIAGGTNNLISIPNSFACGEGLRLTDYDQFPAAAFGKWNLQGITGSGATAGYRIFMVGIGSSDSIRINAFSVNEKGLCVANTSFASPGADFAEYFESFPYYNQKLPCGETVCLINQNFLGKEGPGNIIFTNEHLGKIILSSDVPADIINDSIPFGVVTLQSGFIGNSYDEEWHGKYQKDGNGNLIYEIKTIEKIVEDVQTIFEEKEITELKTRLVDEQIEYYEEKTTVSRPISLPLTEEYPLYDSSNNYIGTITAPKLKKVVQEISTLILNPNYNPDYTYTPRSQRPEWNLVGLLGQIHVNKNARISPRWIKMKQGTEEEVCDMFLIR